MVTDPSEPQRPAFPSLPILNSPPPAPAARGMAEKYGSLFYLAAAGLVVVVGLTAWFAYNVWSLRDIWTSVYVLNDPREAEDRRIRAAYLLSRDPRFEQRQRWDLALNRKIPDLARLLLADGVGEPLVAEDPQAYASAVARSPDWPDWLRLTLTRPLALASARGHTISRERLGELCRLEDPALRLWALFALAVQPRPDPQTLVELDLAARSVRPEASLAAILRKAVASEGPARDAALDRAAAWNRERHHPTASLWRGWRVGNGTLLHEQH